MLPRLDIRDEDESLAVAGDGVVVAARKKWSFEQEVRRSSMKLGRSFDGRRAQTPAGFAID